MPDKTTSEADEEVNTENIHFNTVAYLCKHFYDSLARKSNGSDDEWKRLFSDTISRYDFTMKELKHRA